MPKILIGEAAKILGVSKRTLMRWDEAGKLSPERDSKGRNRLYDRQDVKKLAHLRELPAIQKRIEQYAATTPLNPLVPSKPRQPDELEEMKEAFKSIRDWERKWRILIKIDE